MARQAATIGTITITAAGTTSSAISEAAGYNVKVALGMLIDLIVYAPSALTGTVTLQVAPVGSPSAGEWVNHEIGGVVTTLTAGQGTTVPVGAAKALRVVSDDAEASNRDFILVGQYEV